MKKPKKKRPPPNWFNLVGWGRGIGVLPKKPLKAAKPEPMPQVEQKVKIKKRSVRNNGIVAVGLSGPFAKCDPKTWAWTEGDGWGYKPRKTGTFESGRNFIDKLAKRGYKVLGSGAYSTVLGKDGSDRVLKVTRGSQDNWIDYIRWAAKEGYCGNLAPRVYSWKKFSKCQTFSVSVVERMDKTLRQAKGHDYQLIETLVWPIIQSDSVMARVYMDDLLPGSVPFWEGLKALEAGDIYGKNIMLRKDGSLCVTDPVCGRLKFAGNRLRSSDFTSVAPAIKELHDIRFHWFS